MKNRKLEVDDFKSEIDNHLKPNSNRRSKKVNSIRKTSRSALKKRAKKKPLSNKSKLAKKRGKTITSLIKRTWTIFSKYIRLRDSDENGYCYCISSGKRMFWKEAQAGHFQSRRFRNTLFHEQNVHAQSPFDNKYLAGNQYIYGKKLDEKYGDGTADNIVLLSRKEKKFTVEELEEMKAYYERQVKIMLIDKGLI